jgi:hypothetical protein
MALLWVEIIELYWGRKSGSRLAVEVGDGARYRWSFLGCLRVITEIKSPCGDRGFRDVGSWVVLAS